jgi:hypothetical protein
MYFAEWFDSMQFVAGTIVVAAFMLGGCIGALLTGDGDENLLGVYTKGLAVVSGVVLLSIIFPTPPPTTFTLSMLLALLELTLPVLLLVRYLYELVSDWILLWF